MPGWVPHRGGLPGWPGRVTRLAGVSFLHVKACEWGNPPRGVIKSKFCPSPPKKKKKRKLANNYLRGKFFRRNQLQNFKIPSADEVDIAYDNFVSMETDSQGDQLNQYDVLPETGTKRKVFS